MKWKNVDCVEPEKSELKIPSLIWGCHIVVWKVFLISDVHIKGHEDKSDLSGCGWGPTKTHNGL